MNSKKPVEISVVIPLYNKESTIKKTIDTVLNQTYSNFELLVVDDGSTDSSVEVIKNFFSDSRLTILSKSNGGVSEARNFGADKAVGKWLFFLDADDIIESTCFECLIELSSRYAEATMLVSNFQILDNTNLVNRTYSSFDYEGIIENPFKRIWNFQILPRTGNFFVSTSIFKNTGGFRKECIVYEDLELFLNILYLTKVAYTSKVLLTYLKDHSDLSVNLKPYSKTLPFYIQDFNQKNFYHRLILLELCYRTSCERYREADFDAVDDLKEKLKGKIPSILFQKAWRKRLQLFKFL